METILAAIVGALARLHVPTIKDEYVELKWLLRQKTGEKSRVIRAVEKLEEDVRSDERRLKLEEYLRNAGLDRDEEVLRAAWVLRKMFRGHPAVAVTHVTRTMIVWNKVSGTRRVTAYVTSMKEVERTVAKWRAIVRATDKK